MTYRITYMSSYAFTCYYDVAAKTMGEAITKFRKYKGDFHIVQISILQNNP